MRCVQLLTAAAVTLLLLDVAGARQSGDPVLEQLIIDRAALRLEQAERTLEIRQRELEWANDLPIDEEVGRLLYTDCRFSVSSEVDRREATLVEADRIVKLRRLDLAETELTRREPMRDWRAPLVQGQDFEGDRLRVELEALRFTESRASERYGVMQELVMRRGIPWEEEAAAADALDRARADVDSIRRRIEMRDLMLAQKLPEDATWVLRDEDLERQRVLLANGLGRARLRLAELQPLEAGGIVTKLDLEPVAHRVRELEDALERHQMERDIFDYRYSEWLDDRAEGERRPGR